MVMIKHSQSSHSSKFSMSLQYLKKEVTDEVDFLHVDKAQSSLQVDFNTLGIKVSCKVMLSLLMRMAKYSQSTQSNKFTVFLLYLIKEVRHGIHFLHADKYQSFYKLALSFLKEVARHVQSTQSTFIVIENIQIIYGGPVMFVVRLYVIEIAILRFISYVLFSRSVLSSTLALPILSKCRMMVVFLYKLL